MYINGNENIIEYEVDEAGLTVSELLQNKLNISARLLKKFEKSKSILLNGRLAKMKGITQFKDIITIKMENEEENNIPQKIPIDIIYEDYDLIIINKQPNIVAHPTKSHIDGTLANGIAYYFKERNIKKKVRFVNRLDMDTSGIIVIAKNPFGHQQLASQFENNTVEKKYLAFAEGVIREAEGIINAPIGRDDSNPTKNTVTTFGKESITRYKVVERFKNATLVELNIETGRTHQIRIHLKSIGHPIIGDTLYNKPSKLISRQALHSYSLKFRPPRKDYLITVKADIPDDMKNLINILKNK